MGDTYFVELPDEANFQLPNPELLTYYRGFKAREWWVEGEIDNDILELSRNILYWNRQDKDVKIEDRTPITIFFNSPGGSLDMAYSLFDVIKMSKTPIIGINMGYCASAAAYIFIACHQRKMIKHGYFVFHQGSMNGLNGEYKQIVATIEDYKSQVEELSSLMRERTLYTEEEISRNIINEWYIHREEALEKGVVHSVIEDIEEIV